MKNFKTIKVKYIDHVEQVDNEWLPRYKYKEVTTEFVKQFYSDEVNLYGTSSCSRDLITYLAITMDDDNICGSDSRTITKFKNTIKEICIENNRPLFTYAESTIRKAYKELEHRKVLIRLGRGEFQVNPRLFFKGTDAARKRAIKCSDEYLKGVRDKTLTLKYKVNDSIEDDLKETANIYGEGIKPCVID